jgi:uncharacterized membrane protein
MTAIGFAMSITGFVLGFLNDFSEYRIASKIGAGMVIIGGLTMLIGVGFKLWEIMP